MVPFAEFDLVLPRHTMFGWGKRRSLGKLVAGLGKRAFLICGSKTLAASKHWQEMLQSLTEAKIEVILLPVVTREPTIEDVDAVTRTLLQSNAGEGDVIVGIGGGSSLDLAKAVAAMVTNSGGASVREFLEGIGTGRSLTRFPLPLVAVPTTSGTGSEATKNAVISCDDPPCKKSLRSENMVPTAILLDAELTVSLSPEQTAYSGMDAITQLLESCFSRKSQPATEALCMFGLDLALPSLLKAYRNPKDREAREKMALAALYSGIALANSGLGMAHGVAAALGAICNVPHGLACAVMLPIALKVNLDEIREPLEDLDLAHLLSNKHADMEDAEVIIELIEKLCRDLKIPSRLRDLGVQKTQLPALVSGSRGNSMNGNPVELTDARLLEILEENW